MTLGEFGNAIRQSDGWVVSVHKHKTDIDGPANLTLTHTLYKECCYFLKLVRNKLPGVGLGADEPMFISWSANPMSSSMLTTQMSNIFNKGIGRSLDVRMNPTVVRKYTTTIVHSNESANKQDVADQFKIQNLQLVGRNRTYRSYARRFSITPSEISC